MEKYPMCRICLVKNVHMYVVVNENLHELYEKLTGVPFVTEDSRPMLACLFCCAKLKQCWRLLRKCLEAEELFTRMMNDDYEQDSKINLDNLEFFNGLTKSPIVHTNIDAGYQTDSYAAKVESPDASENPDYFFELKEEYQADNLEHDNVDSNYPVVEDKPALQAESDSEDDVPLVKIKTEIDDELESTDLEHDNVDSNYPVVEDKPALQAESDSEDDVPLVKIKTEIDDELESTGAPVAIKPNLDKLRPTLQPREAISAGHKKNEINQTSCLSKIIKKTQNHTSERAKIFLKQSYTKTQHEDNCSINNTALSTSCRNNSNQDDIKCNPVSKDGVDSEKGVEKHLKCDIFQCSCSVKSNLITHILTHTGEKPFKCDICQRSFSQKSDLVDHTRVHTSQSSFNEKHDISDHIHRRTGEEPFESDICQSSYRSDQIRGEKSYKCDTCQSGFKQRNQLISHIRAHTGEKPFKCEICQRSFSRKSSLTCHARIHTGEKPFKCERCPRSFSRKYNLTSHIRTHTGENPFKCDKCHRTFHVKYNLKQHIHTHTGEKPFKCDICQSSFYLKHLLTNHIRIHTSERLFKCDICQSKFKRKAHLECHTRVHTGEKPVKCEICQRCFSHKCNLKRHIRTHTGEQPLKCDICQRGFSEKSILNRHMRKHAGVKTKCKKT